MSRGFLAVESLAGRPKCRRDQEEACSDRLPCLIQRKWWAMRTQQNDWNRPALNVSLSDRIRVIIPHVAETPFQVAYKGSEVDGGTIDSRDLAQALDALSELVSTANVILNGDTAEVQLRVTARFEANSFDVNLLLDHHWREAVAGIFPALTGLDGAQLLHVLFGVATKGKEYVTGALGLYKALRGEKPTAIRPGNTPRTVNIIFGNNNTIINADADSARLYVNDNVRSAFTRATKPLKRQGMETFSVTSEGVEESISSEDLPDSTETFSAEMSTNSQQGSTRELLVTVIKPDFAGGRWRFSDGSSKFGADMEDQEFQRRVDRREIGFYQGDKLLILLRTTQHIDRNNRLVTVNAVERVIDHKEGPRQKRFLAD